MQDNDNKYVAAWDLKGNDVTVQIVDVKSEMVEGDRGAKPKRKVIVYFKDKEKPLLANVTNCKIISALYGTEVTKWKGKSIVLYPTTCQMKNEIVDCIRVRPIQPSPQ